MHEEIFFFAEAENSKCNFNLSHCSNIRLTDTDMDIGHPFSIAITNCHIHFAKRLLSARGMAEPQLYWCFVPEIKYFVASFEQLPH